VAGDPDYWRLRPRAPAPGTVLGPLAAVPEGRGREFLFGRGPSAFSMFVVRQGERVWGYLNLCPHFSLKLNQRADEFLNEDGTLIRCTRHFAEFRIADGVCVAGACEGSALDPVPVRVADGQIVIGG
jgi:nitrite reductase/ring-hydroxylating ferredoxin subunit